MNTFPIGSRVAVIAGVNRGFGKIVGERTSADRQQVTFDNGTSASINSEWIVSETATKARTVSADAVTSIAAVLGDLGATLIETKAAAEAGFVTIAYTI